MSLTQGKGWVYPPTDPDTLRAFSGISKISLQPTPAKAEVQKERKGGFESF